MYMGKYKHETLCMKYSGILCATVKTLGSGIRLHGRQLNGGGSISNRSGVSGPLCSPCIEDERSYYRQLARGLSVSH